MTIPTASFELPAEGLQDRTAAGGENLEGTSLPPRPRPRGTPLPPREPASPFLWLGLLLSGSRGVPQLCPRPTQTRPGQGKREGGQTGLHGPAAWTREGIGARGSSEGLGANAGIWREIGSEWTSRICTQIRSVLALDFASPPPGCFGDGLLADEVGPLKLRSSPRSGTQQADRALPAGAEQTAAARDAQEMRQCNQGQDKLQLLEASAIVPPVPAFLTDDPELGAAAKRRRPVKQRPRAGVGTRAFKNTEY